MMSGYWFYGWSGVDAEGEPRAGEVLGSDKTSVKLQLIGQHIQPLTVRTKGYCSARYWRSGHLMDMTRQLASLLGAGLPLRESLHLLAEDHPRAGWRCLLRSLGAKIEQGHTLSLACGDFAAVFSPLYRAMLALGELTGRMDHCCRLLAEHEYRQQQLQKKVRGAMRYPIVICLTAALVLSLMLALILPEFARLYDGLNAPLPAPTRGLLTLSDAIGNHGFTWLLTALLLYGMYRRTGYYHPRLRQWLQTARLYLPWLGELIRQHNLHQFFQTLAITHQAGITLDNGLSMAAHTLDHTCYRQAALALQQQIKQGFALHQAVGQQKIFPAHCRHLIKTGEYTGTLDEVFAQLARLHEQQTFRLAETLAQLAEPLLLIITGAVVCALVLVLYLPILQLGEAFGQF